MAAQALTPAEFRSFARRLALERQGLTRANSFGRGREGAAKALEHLGYVQIDTLAVVERAHHHTLWTRVPGYRSNHLNEIVRERRAFEYWFHAAAFLPMRDYRFALRRMEAIRRGDSRWYSADGKSMNHVLERIRGEGPLKARDFESPKKRKGSWWNWKPMKHALERLFMQGDLMVSSRDGMEKIYDLTERVLPSHAETREPTLDEFAEHLVDGALRANGFTTVKQIAHLRTGSQLRGAIQDVLRRRIEAGLVEQFRVEGSQDVFAGAGLFDGKRAAGGANVRLLSPFDNAIIHRDRAAGLFEFDYTLECYVPAAKRKFGYFCLPILYGERFMGRVDCKAHRNEKRLELIHLHLENAVFDADVFFPRFAKAVREFAKFNGCESISLTKVSPRKWARAVRGALVSRSP